MQRSIPTPGGAGLLGEARGLLELPKLLVRFPRLAHLPRGRGRSVLVLPGYGAGDASTGVLRAYLRYLDYRPHGWGLGRNGGEVEALLPRVVARLEALFERAGRPIDLVGWSLGGYLAREAARERSDAARRVVTLGSPVVGGPKYTAVAGAYSRRGVDLDEIEAKVAARNELPLKTPITAIYSRRDGVVAWQACIDDFSASVEHVEVGTTHLGLGFSAEVYEIIAGALAQRESTGSSRRGTP